MLIAIIQCTNVKKILFSADLENFSIGRFSRLAQTVKFIFMFFFKLTLSHNY